MFETIYKNVQNHVKISVEKTYNQKFLDIAEGTLWGTEGIVYKMNHLGSDFDKFNKPIYVSLMENEDLAAICILNQKQVHQNNFKCDAFYLCILAVLPEKMNKGHGTLIVNQITDYILTQYNQAIVYAYVEEDNERSRMVFNKANFKQITTFLAPSNVRLRPKHNTNVAKLNPRFKTEVTELIKKQYNNHSFVDIEESIDPESYYVIMENNVIKAGLQVRTLSWSFVSLSGFEGFLMMKVIPKLPFLKKIFNPGNHTFLKIGNIYIGDGESFDRLLSSVMFEYKLNTCLAYTNPQSKVDSKIIDVLKKGILSSVDSKVMMFYKAKNIFPADINHTPFLSLADSI